MAIRNLQFALGLVAIATVDAFLKYLAYVSWPANSKVSIGLGEALMMTHIHHRGLAFHVFSSLSDPTRTWVTLGFPAAVAILFAALLFVLRLQLSRVAMWAGWAILAGGMSNLLCLLVHGGSIDVFLVLRPWDGLHTPFNLSDLMILAGATVLLVSSLEFTETRSSDTVRGDSYSQRAK